MNNDNEKKEVKPHPGRWVKGQSGNPEGKKPGTKNRTTLVKQAIEGQLVDQLSSEVADILAQAITMAKNGDPQMIKLILDKVLSSAKQEQSETERASGGINIIVKGFDEVKTEKPIEGEKL